MLRTQADVVNWPCDVDSSFPWARFKEEKKKKGNSHPRRLKNPPVRQEMWVQSLGGKDPLEKEMANHSQFSCLKNSMDRGAWQDPLIQEVTKSWA